MTVKLKSLDDHNQQAFEIHRQLNDPSPRPNGIECPDCKAELLDSNPMVTLTSYPAKKNVHCPKCTYRGYRLA